MDALFTWLFKYSPEQFRHGELSLAAAETWLWAAALAALALIVFFYLRAGGGGPPPAAHQRLLLTGLRAAAVALILFCLAQPTLVLSTTVAGRGFVGVLLDDSLSMRIADGEDGLSRGEQLARVFAANGKLAGELAERFSVRRFRFGERAVRLEDDETPRFGAAKTDLAASLAGALRAFAGAPLAGLVVVSDGAANRGDLGPALLGLRAAKVPVYTVGVGRERYRRDLELSELSLPPRLLAGGVAQAELTLRHRGFAGAELQLEVSDGEAIVHRQTLTPEDEAGSLTLRVPLSFDQPGLRRLRFGVAPQGGEILADNNHREALLEVYSAQKRLLYVEGEPRFELKFVRRALAEDPNLQVAALLRTAENKFYRLGLQDPSELSEGFPDDPEELFAYHGLILGSVEASFFTPRQQQMIVDFVSRRGGGLLLLGGKHAFAEGGYNDTPLAELIPFTLDSRAAEGFAVDVALTPTAAGLRHPLLRTDGDTAALTAWGELPPLTVVNPLSQAKPGASVLLSGRNGEDSLLALAQQRYGRGRVLAFAVQNSWLWQMHPDIALDDQTHETLWRRLARWLVGAAPGRLELAVVDPQAAPGETVTIGARLLDGEHRGRNGAELSAVAVSPSGREQPLRFAAAADDGEYRAEFVAAEAGLYEIQVRTDDTDDTDDEGAGGVESAVDYLQVDPRSREFYQAEQRAELLRQIAAETGGRYYPLDAADRLVDDLQYAPSGARVTERYELWDMPALFLGFVLLVGAEWFYRRRRRLR